MSARLADVGRGRRGGWLRRAVFDRPWMRERVYPADQRWGPYRPDPVWRAVLYAAAAGTCAYSHLVRATARLEVIDDAGLPPDQGVIYCIWHADTVSYVMLFAGVHRLTSLIGDSWRIAPSRMCGAWLGLRGYIFQGREDGGRAAAAQLVASLRSGVPTVITPDGPHGPQRVLKRGVLHIAARSGAPIVVITLEATPRWVIPGQWDHKWLPLPFSRIRARLHPPLTVRPEDLDGIEALEATLYDRLGR